MHTELNTDGEQRINKAPRSIYSQPANGIAVAVQNRSDAAVYLGDESVTPKGGIALYPGAIITFSGAENPRRLWAVSETEARVSVTTFTPRGTS